MKHLKSRSPAIQTAVRAYNTAARTLQPPRKILKIKEVLEHTFIGEFDILRDSRNEIQHKPWANPANRIARDAWYRTEAAKVELPHLDVEIARTRDWMYKEEAQHCDSITTCTDPPLKAELIYRQHSLLVKHSDIRQDLQRLRSLPEYKPHFRPKLAGDSLDPGVDGEIGHDQDLGRCDSEEDEDEEREKLDNFDAALYNVDMLG